MVPVAGLMDHVTASPDGRLTTENCLVPAGATVAVAGLTLGFGDASKVMTAVPSTVAELLAVTVMLAWEATVLGAVYRPALEMVPVAGLIDQVTVSPEGKFTTENCLVPEGATVAVAGLTLGVGDASTVMLAVPSTVEPLFAVRVTVV